MKRIYTVQHTQSEHHINGMVGSWTDWNLTDLGKQQADRIAEKLKQEFDGKEIVIYRAIPCFRRVIGCPRRVIPISP